MKRTLLFVLAEGLLLAALAVGLLGHVQAPGDYGPPAGLTGYRPAADPDLVPGLPYPMGPILPELVADIRMEHFVVRRTGPERNATESGYAVYSLTQEEILIFTDLLNALADPALEGKFEYHNDPQIHILMSDGTEYYLRANASKLWVNSDLYRVDSRLGNRLRLFWLDNGLLADELYARGEITATPERNFSELLPRAGGSD